MKYFLGFLVSIGLIILVFILIMRGFSGRGAPEQTNPLTEYANTDAIVRMTVDGPIVSEQEHQAYRISVGRSEVRIDTLKGYEYETIESKTYENNQQAFHNFLRALDLAGYTKGESNTNNQDERGVCANGRRYIEEILSGTSEVQRYWSTSCRGGGTFKGNTEEVKTLFDRQIPTADYSRMVGRLRI